MIVQLVDYSLAYWIVLSILSSRVQAEPMMPGHLLSRLLCLLLCISSVMSIPMQTVPPAAESKQLNIVKASEPTPISNKQTTNRDFEKKSQHRCPMEDQSMICILVRLQDRLNRMETIVYSIINITESTFCILFEIHSQFHLHRT